MPIGITPTGTVPMMSPVAASNAATMYEEGLVTHRVPADDKDLPMGSAAIAVLIEVFAIENAGDGALRAVVADVTALTVAIYVPAASDPSVADASAAYSPLTSAGFPRF